MKVRYSLRLLAAFAAIASTVSAQTASNPAATEEPAIVLSPFVVSSTEDVGYAATRTLAGSRIRTNVEDVGAAISIVTDQFLDDTNSTTLRDVLVYTAGT